MTALALTSLAVYGFELFNFNLTIDEELHALLNGPSLLWMGEGRWGMYLLNAFILPCPVVPTVPLLVALVLHGAAALLTLECWRVHSRAEKISLGALMLTLPTLAYDYMFSTLSHGIGCGFFCASLSLYLFQKGGGRWRWSAVFPAAFSIAIYQPFALVLATLFTVHLAIEIQRGQAVPRDGVRVALMLIVSFLLYALVQKTSLWLLSTTLNDADGAALADRSSYIQTRFDFQSLRSNPSGIAATILKSMLQYYSGRHSNYMTSVGALAWVVIASLAVFGHDVWGRAIARRHKLVAIVLLLLLLALPFAGGILSNGVTMTRTLLALPVALAGVVLLGLRCSHSFIRAILLFLVSICIFQCGVATNRLFGIVHLSLEADRLLAIRVMDKLDEAVAISGGKPPVYLEVVGKFSRGDSSAIPRRGTFGLSFFELTKMGQGRVAAFLEICGYRHLEALSFPRQAEFVDVALQMPAWPAEGSVKVVGDTALIKFSDFTDMQKEQIRRRTGRALPPDGVSSAGNGGSG